MEESGSIAYNTCLHVHTHRAQTEEPYSVKAQNPRQAPHCQSNILEQRHFLKDPRGGLQSPETTFPTLDHLQRHRERTTLQRLGGMGFVCTVGMSRYFKSQGLISSALT